MKHRIGFFLASALCFAALILSSCGGTPLHKYTYYGMGTYTTVSVEGGAPREIASILAGAENELSHRVSDSVIARANRGETVTVEGDLLETLLLCETLYRKTDGRFDISVLPLTSLWNFDAAPTSPPAPDEIESALALVGFDRAVSLVGGSLRVLRGGLDLGAVGKGLACDRIVAHLEKAQARGLVSVGGSLGVAGSGRTYTVGVRDPFSSFATDLIGKIRIGEGFVSTSGTYEKKFESQGRSYHHILNAESGYPEENALVSVTVVANSGVLSDALSTAAFLVGEEGAISLCREFGAWAIAVKADGTLLVSRELEASFAYLGKGAVIYQ
jgi:thiamine biosynthesis lipoprotein